MLSQVVSVQSCTPREVRHICFAQKESNLRRLTESSEMALPDGAAHLLDHVVVDLAKGVEALNSLVSPERGGRALREEKRATEHHNCVVALLEFDRFFGWGVDVFIPSFGFVFLFVTAVDGVFVRGLAAVPPCLASTLEGLIVSNSMSISARVWGRCRTIPRPLAIVVCVGLVSCQSSVQFFLSQAIASSRSVVVSSP